MLCIGTKRGQNHGLVYDEAGTILGHVERHSRVAAGLKGQRRLFWTATLRTPDGRKVTACSLGTRHPDRWSAARAIQAFHEANPDLTRTAVPTTRWGYAYDAAISHAAACFKFDRFDVCKLPYRPYADPRAV
jgi:hypothetical protein